MKLENVSFTELQGKIIKRMQIAKSISELHIETVCGTYYSFPIKMSCDDDSQLDGIYCDIKSIVGFEIIDVEEVTLNNVENCKFYDYKIKTPSSSINIKNIGLGIEYITEICNFSQFSVHFSNNKKE